MQNPINSISLPFTPPPVPGPEAGQRALKALFSQRNILTSLEAIHQEMGNVFQIPLPGFSPVFLVGPDANRFVTVTGREDLRWRSESDPVVRVLRQGLLVTDGEFHDKLRHRMLPSLHKGLLDDYLELMWQRTDQITATWKDGQALDMLVEMRKIALLILVDALFKVDLSQELHALWPSILRMLAYISPGLWLIWPSAPRFGYTKAIQKIDDFLYRIIAERRNRMAAHPETPTDLLGLLVATPDMPDGLIRDQLITMLIAGHDTSTALLAWSLYLLGAHPETLAKVQVEVDGVLGDSLPTMEAINQLVYLEQVMQETLRLYPPIHIGNRIAAIDLEFQGYRIPAGTRVVYSIYLTHRMPEFWPDPERFDPQRFISEQVRQRPHYTYMPFGGGPRNCIGLAFAQVEVKVVLARLLQNFNMELLTKNVHAHMGATLEPRPGVKIRLQRRHVKPGLYV